MLKKLFFILLGGTLLAAGFWVFERLSSNPGTSAPYPYVFVRSPEKIAVDAPILIVGDRMAHRFGLFKETLSYELSTGLSKPLQIATLTKDLGIHRTLQDLSILEKWPKVLIYTGGSQEFLEEKFLVKDIPTIRYNFSLFNDERWRSLLMLWPEFSRLLYMPFPRRVLPDVPPEKPTQLSEEEYHARLELSYQLYELELGRLIETANKHKALLILITAPVNLDVSPRKTCTIATSPEIRDEMSKIRELVKAQDYKAAFPLAQALAEATMGNTEVFYLFGQVAHRAGRDAEAKEALQKAAAFDCEPWRANQAINNIIRKVALDQRVILFDFAQMVEDDWNKNVTFFNEIYPQDLYYERANKSLAVVLRRMLKL